MSNPYYNRQTECNPGELADGLAIEAEFDSIQRAFDKLPVPHRDGGGFEGAVKVGTATSDEDAVPKAQLTEALGAVLSKSGNLAGLADKPTARGNLGLGDAATKNVGVAAGSVASGDHKHNRQVIVGGRSDTFYPVLLNGDGARLGVAINRDVHMDGQWAGSLRMNIRGAGLAWGGDFPYLDYEFTQLWGGGDSYGCLADIACSSVSGGIYVWLRGARTYLIHGVDVSVDVYLTENIEANGTVFAPKTTGPLYQRNNGAALDGPQLFRGPIANNMPYWNGENLPVTQGAFTPYLSDSTLTAGAVTAQYMRHGDICTFRIYMTIAGAGSLTGGQFVLHGLPFSAGATFTAIAAYASMLTAGTSRPGAPIFANVSQTDISFYFVEASGNAAAILNDHIRPNAKGQIELILSGSYKIV